MKDWITYALGIAHQYPQLTAGVLGVLFSMAAVQVLKYLIPDHVTDSDYKKVVRGMNILLGWAFGYAAWVVLDPTDGRVARLFYATGVGFISAMTYSIVVGALVAKWPTLDKYLRNRPSAE